MYKRPSMLAATINTLTTRQSQERRKGLVPISMMRRSEGQYSSLIYHPIIWELFCRGKIAQIPIIFTEFAEIPIVQIEIAEIPTHIYLTHLKIENSPQPAAPQISK